MKVVVFRHMKSNGLGSIDHVLQKSGIPYHYIDTYHEDLEGFDPYGADLLIVMGGALSVYQDNFYPFLNDEIRILEKRIARDLPTLGICLGAQLIAKTLGQDVYKGAKGYEMGWHPIHVTEAGMKTPLRHLDAQHTHLAHWHGDTFDLPDGATLLASSALYENQAFSYGEKTLALQCHAEATPCLLKSWLVSHASDVAAGHIDVHKVRDDTEKYGSTLINQTEKFLTEWLEQVSEN